MSRAATRWAYSDKVIKRGLSANELAVLRVICWKYDEQKRWTDPISNAQLTAYTGIRSPQTLDTIRKKLCELRYIGYQPANKVRYLDDSGFYAKGKRTYKKETTKAYAYFVVHPKYRNYDQECPTQP